jgi:hypothetical protein
LRRDDLRRLLNKLYPVEKPQPDPDPAMEMHLRLLAEQAEDALDRQLSAHENIKRQMRRE